MAKLTVPTVYVTNKRKFLFVIRSNTYGNETTVMVSKKAIIQWCCALG